MRLAEDDRGRVPFALVGALLLVSSTAFATTLSTRGPTSTDRAVDTAMERVDADATRAVEAAVRDAARRAAREPVTRRANTSFGRVLNESSPFRDALRIRIYVAARRHLRTTEYRRGDVIAVGSLPPTPDVESLRRAKRRVEVRSRQNGTGLSVTLRNVTLTARRDGRVVARESHRVNVTASTPVLETHRRVERFERRLNRGPLAGPGLGRQLTARLYPVVWARAYGQYRGAPISNVLANRHVELSTNGAVLRTQRAVFGRSDPDGRRGLRRATARTSVRDLTAPTDVPVEAWTDRVLPRPNGPPRANGTIPEQDVGDAPGPNRTFRIGANASADRPFVEMLSETRTGDAPLSRVVRAEYRVSIRRRTAVRTVRRGRRPSPDPPGAGWTLIDESTETDATVRDAPGPEPSIRADERVFARFSREVTERHRVERAWVRGNATRTTAASWTDVYRVGIAVVGEDALPDRAPERSVRPRFERGGALDGPNLRTIPERARRRLVDRRGGRDAVARRVASGSPNASETIVGTRPEEVDAWVAADLADLRRRVRNVSVTVRGGTLASGRANPPAKLARRLDRRRAALVDAPETYDGVVDRARVAARTAYLDRVVSNLRTRAANRRTRMGVLDGALAAAGDDPTPPTDAERNATARLSAALDARKNRSRSRRRTVAGGAGGPVRFVPDAEPGYLTLGSVDRRRVVAAPADGYHPLAARNVNAFTIPYGDAADAVVETTLDADGVRLATAGRTLVAADRTLDVRNDADLRERRNRLREATAESLETVEYRARTVLRRETSLPPAARRAAVEAATDRWSGVGRRALAASNGSLAAAVAAEADRHTDDRVRESRLRVRLRVELRAAARSRSVRVSEGSTDRTAAATREAATRVLERAIESGANGTDRNDYVDGPAVGGVPAGLPVAPAPGYWYATVNVWTVEVRGAYAKFAVRTGRGTPNGPVRYVRDGSVVRLDVDGDGREERLGRGERVAFETSTAVAVAVPPRGRGVGDVNGDADERSAGWPRPACTSPDGECPLRKRQDGR